MAQKVNKNDYTVMELERVSREPSPAALSPGVRWGEEEEEREREPSTTTTTRKDEQLPEDKNSHLQVGGGEGPGNFRV